MPTLPPSMTAAPATPDRANRSTFAGLSVALDDWRKNIHVPEMVAALMNVYDNAVSAFNDAVSAAASAITATTQATNAAASAVSASGSALTAINAPGTSATSATSAAIGTGSKSLTIQTGKSLVSGMSVTAADEAAPSANQMTGIITSYNSGTGALVFTVGNLFIGSGTKTAWIVSLASLGSGASLAAANFTMQATVIASGTLSLALTGTPWLVGATIASFEVTPSWGAVSTVDAAANAGTKSLTATATIGQVLSVSVVAIDSYGNRSSAATHTATVVTHAAPTGTITVNKPTSVLQLSTGNQISFSGGTATDGATITYQINATGSPQYTFSKTTAIASGEVVTFAAPALGTQTDISFTAQMNDSLGASSTPQSVTITATVANIIGVAMTATGGNGGTWSHIDSAGADITSPTAVTNNSAVCTSNPTFAGHAAFALTDVTIDGQAMVRLPKFYYKTGVISGGANNGLTALWISNVPATGFAVHPAFMLNGSEIAQFYYGKYQARFDGAKLTSLSGGTPAVSRTLTQFQADAAARNTGGVTGFQLHNFWQLAAIQMLYLVENKTMGCQTKTDAGITAAGAAVNVESALATYRGIVGLWGNVWQALDGFKTLNGVMYTHNINGTKPASSGAGITDWVSQGAPSFLDGAWHYSLTFKSTTDLTAAFINSTSTTTITSATCPDGQLFYNGVTTTEYIPYSGGHWGSGSGAGLWYLYCGNGASDSSTTLGARLAKV